MQVQFDPTPDDDTAAAILAALACCLEPSPAQEPVAASPRSAWRAAGVLAAQGLTAGRGAHPAGWATAERAARAARWSQGIVGM